LSVSPGLLLTLAAVLVVPACAATGPAAPHLGCELKVVGSPHAGGPAMVRMTLKNPGERPLFALAWGTPFEERWMGTPFTLRGPDGAEVPFQGPMVKRGDPGRDDYELVPAKGSVEADADLAAVYDLSRPGEYELSATRDLYDLADDETQVPRPRDRHQGAKLECAPLRFTVAPAATAR